MKVVVLKSSTYHAVLTHLILGLGFGVYLVGSSILSGPPENVVASFVLAFVVQGLATILAVVMLFAGSTIPEDGQEQEETCEY